MSAVVPLLVMAGFFAGLVVPHRPIDRFGRMLGVITVAALVAMAYVIPAVLS